RRTVRTRRWFWPPPTAHINHYGTMRSRQIPQGGSTAAPSFSLEAHFRFESIVLDMHKPIEPIGVDQIRHQCPRKDTGNASRRNNRETLRPLRWIFRGMSITHSEVQSIICSEVKAVSRPAFTRLSGVL